MRGVGNSKWGKEEMEGDKQGDRGERVGGLFQRFVGGVECRVVRGKSERRRQGKEREISREEIRRVMRNLRDDKAMGVYGILNEVCKYGGERMEEWVWKACNKGLERRGLARGMEGGGSSGAEKEKGAGAGGEGL